jgi:hypothetical protein
MSRLAPPTEQWRAVASIDDPVRRPEKMRPEPSKFLRQEKVGVDFLYMERSV